MMVCYNIFMEEMKRKMKDVSWTIFGTFLLCLAVEMFILPFNILSGGVAGIAVALEPFLHFDKTMFANVLTVAMLFLGRFVLGKDFFVNTVISSLFYPLFNSTLVLFITRPDIDPILASFYGGLLGGLGVGLVMKTGASTGGMDVPALILHKITGVKIGVLALCIDGMTVLLGWSAYGLEAVLVGMVSVFISSYAIDKVLEMGTARGSKQLQIISEEWEWILIAISTELKRGATIIDAKGSRSHELRRIILVVVSNKEYSKLIEMVNEIDPKAFVITTDASDMHGEGFTYGFRI